MSNRRQIGARNVFALAGLLAALLAWAQAQQQRPAPNDAISTIKVETRVVLVDSVVTDKKGNYIRDLEAKDFKVWEDGKEQPVTSFSREDDNPNPAHPTKHYLVLFFDNSTMEFSDQAKARDAAAKFIDSNAAPDRLIAIVEFGGMLRIAQNFTSDADRLKKVVAGVKFSTVNPNAPSPDLASTAMPTSTPDTLGFAGVGNLESDFGARSVFLGLRNLAKGLSGVSGRKSVIMLTAGFPMNSELQSELTAVIDACNRANVAVYPIDVRGLLAPVPSPIGAVFEHRDQTATAQIHPAGWNYGGQNNNLPPMLRFAAYALPAQHVGGGGGGGTGGGGHGGGGTGGGGGVGGGGGHGGTGGGGGTGSGGGKGGTGGTGGGTGGTGGRGGVGGGTVNPNYYNSYNNPMNQPRTIIPQIPDVAANQQLLYQLADGTGGFVIVNTNDLLGGMERIAKDQGEYYLLGYKPPDSAEGSCHTLKVKVDRGGTNVRSRSGYCKVRPKDLLAGSTTEKDLESRAVGEMPGNVTATLRTPYFYDGPEQARVHMVLDIPSNSLQFEKVKGKQHADINILGIAYTPSGAVGARFSDTVNLDLDDKKAVEEFQKSPFHYENQFDVAPGTYNLRVAFSSGNKSFGKLETPLTVATYDGKNIGISSIVLSNNLTRVSELDTVLDSQLLEDRKPLIARGYQILPSASNHFKTTDNTAVYVEVYDPLLSGDKPPQVGIEFRVVDKKTGKASFDVGVTDTKDLIKPGNPLVPIGLKLPVSTLPPGSYRVDIRAQDSIGHSTTFQTTDFEVE